MPREDAELLAKASRGDQSAFAALYAMYETDLYRFVFHLAGGPEGAEELFQETWLRAVRHLGRRPVLDFKRWLFAIAANLHRDELRKKKIRRLVFSDQPIDTDDAESGARERPAATSGVKPVADGFAIRDALRKAMKKLTHRQRTIFVLMYVEGWKIREVSELLGKPEGTVKSTLHRALEILRGELKEFR